MPVLSDDPRFLAEQLRESAGRDPSDLSRGALGPHQMTGVDPVERSELQCCRVRASGGRPVKFLVPAA